MRHRSLLITLVIAILSASFVSSQKAPPAPKPTPGLLERVLKFLGVSDTPATLKAPDAVKSGTIWIADLRTGATHALTTGENFRSPIFLAWNDDLVALHGAQLVLISGAAGRQTTLFSKPDVVKLVGSSSQGGQSILVLLRSEEAQHPRVGILTMTTGEILSVPYSAAQNQDLQTVEALEGSSRSYGDRRVYVGTQGKSTLTGRVEWQDVYLQVGQQAPVDISQCDGVDCGQPSLSPDGSRAVFLRSRSDTD